MVGGIMIPTRRRVYIRNPDDSPVPDSVSAADITDVTMIPYTLVLKPGLVCGP